MRMMDPILRWLDIASRSARGSLTSGVGLLALAKYAAAGVGLVTTVVTARVLGPQQYGKTALLMGYPLLVWSFASLKSLSVTTRYMAGFRSAGRLCALSSISKLGFGLDLLSGLATTLVIAISGGWVNRNLFGVSDLALLSAVFGMSFPFYSLLGTSYAILSSCERVRMLAGMQVLERLMTFLLIVAALTMGSRIAGVIIATAAAQVIVGITAALAATLSLRREGAPPWWRANFSHIESLKGELRTFFGWNYLSVSFAGLIGHGPALLLGYWQGPKAAGYFRLAMSVFSVSSYAEASLWSVIYPRLSIRWLSGDLKQIKVTLWRWSRHYGVPLALTLLGAAALMPYVFPLVFGESFADMVPGAQLLMVGAAISGLFFYLGPVYYAAGMFDLWAKAYGLHALLVIGLAPAAIDWGGFRGTAALVGLGLAAFNICMVEVLRRSQFLEGEHE